MINGYSPKMIQHSACPNDDFTDTPKKMRRSSRPGPCPSPKQAKAPACWPFCHTSTRVHATPARAHCFVDAIAHLRYVRHLCPCLSVLSSSYETSGSEEAEESISSPALRGFKAHQQRAFTLLLGPSAPCETWLSPSQHSCPSAP